MKIHIEDNIKVYLKRRLFRVGLYTILGQFLLIITNLIKANGISMLIDASSNGNINKTGTTAMLILVALLLGYTIRGLLSIIKSKYQAREKHSCELVVMRKVLSNRLSKLYHSKSGEILENLTDDLSTCINYYADTIPAMCCAMLQVLVYSVYIGMLHPLIIVILFVIALVQIVPPFIVSQFMDKYYGETREVEAEITEQIIQGYQGLAEIKRNHAENWAVKRFEELHKKVYKVDLKNQRLLQGENSMENMVKCLLTYGTFACMGLLTLGGVFSLDVALQAVVLSTSFFESVKEVFDIWPQRKLSKVASDRLNIWFIENEENLGNEQSLLTSEEYIHFQQVGYGSEFEAGPLYSEIDITIPLDEISILMGVNGAGKSTLVKLIIGLIRPEKGLISVCGTNPEDLSDECRGEMFFFLPQEEIGFSMTPLQFFEICAADRMSDCRAIAARFGLKEEVLSTAIADLSGGERKKVFLSLAFGIDRKKIILLDEPTNSLDKEGIEVLCELLRERNCRTVIISHNNEITALPYRKYYVRKGGEVHE